MKWVITSQVHYDRVASPWLIERFIDPEAEFQFLPARLADQIPADAIPLAFPGVELGPHDDQGPLFKKILVKYELDDAALHLMAEVIQKGVDFVLYDFSPSPDDHYGQMAVGLVSFSDGMLLIEESDRARLDRSYVVWDAIYELFSEGRQFGYRRAD
jgi:hypothetical protein